MSTLFDTEAQRIIHIIKQRFVLPSGLLSLQMVDGKLDPRSAASDLGDIVPFLMYFGESEFVLQQVDLLSKMYPSAVFPSETPMGPLTKIIKSYEYTDLLLGLLELCRLTKDTTLIDYTRRALDVSYSLFGFKNSWTSFVTKRKIALPLRDFRDGMFIEIYLEAAEVLDDARYAEWGHDVADQVLKSSFYAQHGLWPDFESSWSVLNLFFKQRFYQTSIMKANSNTLYGILDYIRRSGPGESLVPIFRKSLEVIRARHIDADGLVYNLVNQEGQRQPSLSAAVALIEILCDASVLLQTPEYRDAAITIADRWLIEQLPSGLFPEEAGGARVFIDSCTDIVVTFYKLSEITYNNIYRDAADKCQQAMIEIFGKYDYPVYLSTDGQSLIKSRIKSKFLTLFLKTIILKNEYEGGAGIYSDSNLFTLLKDR